MSLESILNHIVNETDAQKEKIIQEARQQAERVIQTTRQEADALYQDIIGKTKADYENQKHRLIVNARLEQKKSLLETKQELIDNVFKKLKSTLASDQFKKQQISADKVKEVPEDLNFYLGKTRQDYETEIARILFE